MQLIKSFAARLPDSRNMTGLYAVIVCLVYSWTLFTSFYKLPAWMFYLNLGEIASIYAYAFLFDLAESILLLLVVLFFEFTLFLYFKNREEFQTRAVIMAFALLCSMAIRLALFKDYEQMDGFVNGEAAWWASAVAISMLCGVLVSKSPLLRRIVGGFTERAVIFLYIYLPLSLLSVVVVIWRNLF
jgi:hypothetical protein